MPTVLLTATPTDPPTYSPSMADTFSWVPVQGAGRPLFARATYLANAEDIKVSLSAGDINVSLDELELNTDEIESLLRTSNSNLTGLDLGVITFNRQLSGQVLTLNTELTGQILTFNRQLTGQVDTFNRQLTGQVDTFNRQLTGQVDTFNRQLTGQVLTINQNISATSTKQDTTNTLLNSQLGQAGFNFIVGGQTANSGPYSTIQVVSACKISGLTATNTTVGDLTAFELPANFAFNGPITAVTLAYGAVIVYKL